jgi:hypothetical protein
MNFEELIRVIKHQEWVVEIINVQGSGISITMAHHGILVITFNEDGTLSFPSNIPFLPPEYHHWSFDEDAQQIKIFDSQNEVTAVLGMPQLIGTNRLVMHMLNQRRRLIAYPELKRNIRKANTPNFPLSAGDMVLAFRYSVNSVLHKVIENNNLRVHRVKNNPNGFAGLEEIFNYLIEHPHLKQVAIVDDEDWDSNPFDLSERDVIRLNENKFMLVGNRALMIEVIGKVLIEYNHEAYNQRLTDDTEYTTTITEVVKKYFSGRAKISSV